LYKETLSLPTEATLGGGGATPPRSPSSLRPWKHLSFKLRFFFVFIFQESSRINKEGELVVQSSRFRNQQKNLTDGVQKVREILENVSFIPNETSDEKKAKISELYVFLLCFRGQVIHNSCIFYI
jgi:hypothetical protein